MRIAHFRDDTVILATFSKGKLIKMMNMKLPYFLLFIVAIGIMACKNDATPSMQTPQYQQPILLQQTNKNVPVFHTYIEITDTILSPNTKFFTDSIVYALQSKYIFIDPGQEIRVLADPHTITPAEISQYFPYIMQMHIGQAPAAGNFQKITVGYTVTQTSFMHLVQRVQGAKPTNMTSDFATTYWPSCGEDTPGCRVKYMVSNIVSMAFK